ncbi:MAG: signal peptidase II [Acidimicrobiia bacterium]|nr:signal peptidase II [Acidimicrobiia bacterium]MBV8559578.1 signal peptidase II [Acidimicrobiia bacterium]
MAAGVVAADQFSKRWAVDRLSRGPIAIVGSIRLALTRNTGGAFGLGSGVVPVVVLAVIALVVIVFVVGRSVDRAATAVALGLVLGGAVGNLADRLFRSPGFGRGSVVDFVDFRFWPVFNVADAAITCGCVLLVLISFGRSRREP